MMLRVLADSAFRSLALSLVAGLGLRILNPRSARLRAAAWTFVLIAACAMPVLSRWHGFEISSLPGVRSAEIIADQPKRVVRTAVPSNASDSHGSVGDDLGAGRVRIALLVYLGVTTLLLIRFIIGFGLTQRTWWRAKPIVESWAHMPSVRESSGVRAPAASIFGILFPTNWIEWDSDKLQAVLAHERSHISHGDVLVRLLATLHAAVFWFSPLAWWLCREISELHEAASDDEALGSVCNRSAYAETLLFFAHTPQRASFTLSMARAATVSRRVERILAESFAPARATARQYAGIVACLVGATAIIAGTSMRAQETPGHQKPQDRFEPFVIVSGNSETMSGSTEDVESARSLRSRYAGDYLWFLNRGKSYVITEPSTVARAKELFRPQEEVGRQQEDLGAQQEKLGAEQEKLGQQQEHVAVRMPDMSAEIYAIQREIKSIAESNTGSAAVPGLNEQVRELSEQIANSKNMEATQDQIAGLQERVSQIQSQIADSHAELASKLSELQSRFGELQSRTGDEQSRLGTQQSELGEQQSRLGDQQSKLGAEQAELAEKATRQIRKLIEEAMHDGRAMPVQ